MPRIVRAALETALAQLPKIPSPPLLLTSSEGLASDKQNDCPDNGKPMSVGGATVAASEPAANRRRNDGQPSIAMRDCSRDP